MAITTKDFSTLVSDMITAIQAASAQIIDFTIGSVMRALVEANAAVGLWVEGLILQLLATTRAATSSGSDLDSWMADYGVTRLAATAATGSVTFSRFTPTAQALIPFGAQVQTSDASQKYAVVADVTNPAYTSSGYVIAAGTASVTVPVQAVAAGAAGNAAAGQVSTLSQAITYVDTVTNALTFVGGSDAETDAQLRARFVLYIASLSRATLAAIGFAIKSVQAGVSYTLVENQQYNGTTDNGYFYVVVDDGSGAPTSGFLTAVTNAIESVRGVTTRFGVYSPVIENATITMTVALAAGYDPTATKLLVANAIKAFVNALGMGQTLTYTRLAQIAYDASPGVINVTAVQLNGGTADLVATSKQVIKWQTVTVS